MKQGSAVLLDAKPSLDQLPDLVIGRHPLGHRRANVVPSCVPFLNRKILLLWLWILLASTQYHQCGRVLREYGVCPSSYVQPQRIGVADRQL
eukprot:COSAG02_NODE_1029_length_15083_cov_8.066271_6_plen_92_part_00